MYEPRRGSAGNLRSSNFNGKLPGEGGENICIYRCVCSEDCMWLGWQCWWVRGELGALTPHPRGVQPPRTRGAAAWPSAAVTGDRRAAGWERGAGAAQDAWVL